MKKILLYVLPISLLIFFIFIMNSGNFFKQPRSSDDDFEAYASVLEQDMHWGDWKKAGEDFEFFYNAWQIIIPRIQFSVEKDEINEINVNLSRLKSYIKTENSDSALAELSEIKEHWENLNN